MAFLVAAVIILALFPIIPPKNKMDRMNGLTFLFIYAAYLVMLFKI